MSNPQSKGAKPVLALAIGDPAGVGPELAARALADREVRAAADFIIVGDRRVLARGAEVAELNRADYERFGKLIREANIKAEQ